MHNKAYDLLFIINKIIIIKGVSEAGATYIQWGRTSCPNTNGTELVYAGEAGGTYYSTQGGAANKLCLPEDPDYLTETSGISGSSIIWGAEYEDWSLHSSLEDHRVPCAICYIFLPGHQLS